jgi:LPS-assembly protein
MFFNYKENSFSKVLNTISYSTNKFVISLSHLYKDTFLAKTTTTSPYTSYITSSLRYNYNEHYSYHINNNYDYENGLKKSFEVGFLYKKRCWDFGIRYLENIRPVLTQTGSSSVADKFVFFTIRLKPLMPSNQPADFIYTLPKGADN